MITYFTRGIGEDAFQEGAQPQNLHFDAGFFQQFAVQGLLQGFTHLHRAAGKAPLTQGRLFAPAHQENLIPFKDNGPNPNNRLIRIVSFHK